MLKVPSALCALHSGQDDSSLQESFADKQCLESCSHNNNSKVININFAQALKYSNGPWVKASAR